MTSIFSKVKSKLSLSAATLRLAAMKIFSMGALLALNALLAAVLPPDQFGKYHFIVGIVGILGSLLYFGIPAVPLRYAARYYDRSETSYLKGLIWSSYTCVLAISLAVSILLGTCPNLFLTSWTSQLNEADVRNIGWCVGIVVVHGLTLNFARSLEWHMISQAVELLGKPIAFAAALFAVYSAVWGSTALSVVVVQHVLLGGFTFVQIVALLICLWHCIHHKKATVSIAQWLKYSLSSYPASVIAAVVSNIELVIAGMILSPADAAIYCLSIKLAAGLSFFRATTAIVAIPRYMRLQEEKASLESFIRNNKRTNMILTLTGAVGLSIVIVLANKVDIIPAGYSAVVLALPCIAIAHSIRSVVGNVDGIMLVMRPRAFTALTMIFYACYILALYVLGHTLGLWGMIVATLASYSVYGPLVLVTFSLITREVRRQ